MHERVAGFFVGPWSLVPAPILPRSCSQPRRADFFFVGMEDSKDNRSFPEKLSSSDVALAPRPPVPTARNDVWVRLDMFLLPVVTLIFFLSFLVSHFCRV